MDLSFLATQKATPKRSGWLRYFFVAMALYPPVYVHAATVTPDESGKTITVDTGTVTLNVNPDDQSDDTLSNCGVAGGKVDSSNSIFGSSSSSRDAEPVYAYVPYGYAYDANYTGENTDNINTSTLTGDTSIVKFGDATLVLNSTNNFTGGVKVDDGALYLGTAGAAGTGTITLNTDTEEWNHYVGVLKYHWETGSISNREYHNTHTYQALSRKGAELMVNFADNEYNSVVSNSIYLSSGKGGGEAHISTGLANYSGTVGLPSDSPRNVVLSGGIFGDGKGDVALKLHGYSYTDHDGANVSRFIINKTALGGNDSGYKAFAGTVELLNTFNESNAAVRPFHTTRLTAGAVQLNLQDDVFAKAVLNLERHSTQKEVGWDGDGWNNNTDHMAPSLTSDNILVLDGEVALEGLEATFQKQAWRYGTSWGATTTHLDNISQASERWRVRVVTSDGDYNTLTLDDNDATHKFDGAIGFAQSYVGDGQKKINEYSGGTGVYNAETGTADDASFTTTEGGTLGVAGGLNLVKKGTATQYIHSAMLKDVTLEGGTLGFNNLVLSGNLTLKGGTTLHLGADQSNGGPTTWTNDTKNDSITIAAGKTLSVAPTSTSAITSTVSGNITLAVGADLDFSYLNGTLASTVNTDSPLLSVSGTLTLQPDTAINITFADLADVQAGVGKTYYLAAAQSGINVGTSDASAFTQQLITLGNGYYGILNTINSATDVDYLVMTISGDPRRTWSGYYQASAANGENSTWGEAAYTWYADTSATSDLKWKEKQSFQNVGQVVVFGNVYKPANQGAVEWKDDTWLVSSETTSTVDTNTKFPGNAGKVTVDGVYIEGFEYVRIDGQVAPVAVIINPDYKDSAGNVLHDDTNYYFFADSDESGIRDLIWEGDNKDEVLGIPAGTQTTLVKQGLGTAIIATKNTYSGGTTIEGGRLVMQHAEALGTGGVTIQNGATLQGDFGGNTGYVTAHIANTITVKDRDGVADEDVDAILKASLNKKFEVNALSGAADTVLLLEGSSNPNADDIYSTFRVLDPSLFSGVVKTAVGKVQLEVLAGEQSGNWENATIDLSTNAANRTVLALDATQAGNVKVGALTGSGNDSSVLNMTGTEITLQFTGKIDAVYDGVLGYGEYRDAGGNVKHAVGNYTLTDAENSELSSITTTTLNVEKHGTTKQTVNSAWVNKLSVIGGSFAVTEDLVVKTINVAHGNHLMIGSETDGSYGLNVGMGGILAIEGSGVETDAFANVGGGNAPYVNSVPTADGNYNDIPFAPTNFILFGNGATITAAGDWATSSTQQEVTVKADSGKDVTINYTRDIKIADGANVTFNTHHYTADASFCGTATYLSSHVMQMLSDMSGNNVHLTFNNENISAGAADVKKTDNGYGYTGATGTEMGYVAIKDIHQFTGDSDITVKTNTVLQVTDKLTNVAAEGAENPVYRQNADMKVYLDGDNAAIQFTDSDAEADGTTVRQYVNNVEITNGAHLLVGGALVDSNDDIKNVDSISDARVNITNRGEATSTFSTRAAATNESPATLTNLNILSTTGTDVNGQIIKTDSIGGTDDTRANISNSTITTKAAAEGKNNLVVHDANLINSLVEIHSGATVNLTDAVLVDYTSSITGNNKGTNETSTAIVGTGTTVEMAFATGENGIFATTSKYTDVAQVNGIGYLTTTSFGNIDVEGEGLTLDLQLAGDIYTLAKNQGFSIIGIQVSGEGKFDLTESEGLWMDSEAFVITGFGGSWVTTDFVDEFVGNNTENFGEGRFIWLSVPEPTTATLSLLALTALAARRRRK